MKSLEQLNSRAGELGVTVAKLIELCTRIPKWDTQQSAWRHEKPEDDVILFLLLKLAGSASATNAMLELAGRNFWFEAAVLARTVYDANLSITFMLPTSDLESEGWPTNKQVEHLQGFAAETWDNPERPFEESRQRSHISIKNMKTALGRFQSAGDEMNPYDTGQIALQMMRFLSDYTHMAYPRLMEFLEPDHGYRLSGEQTGSAFGPNCVAGTILYFAHTADSVALLIVQQLTLCAEHAKTGATVDTTERLEKKMVAISEIQNTLSRLSAEIEAIVVDDSASSNEFLARFKGK